MFWKDEVFNRKFVEQHPVDQACRKSSASLLVFLQIHLMEQKGRSFGLLFLLIIFSFPHGMYTEQVLLVAETVEV